MSFTDFQQVDQHDYQEKSVINYVHISSKTFYLLEIANEAQRLSFVN